MDTSGWQGLTLAPGFGVVEAVGDDAATFLHGQLSQDMVHLALNQPALAAYCSPKGRMLASLWVWRTAPDRFWLVMDASVLPATLKRLRMFVMRAKCTLTDVSDRMAVVGGVVPEAVVDTTALPWATSLAPVPGQPRTGTGSRLAWAIWPTDEVDARLAEGPRIEASQWSWLLILTGVPRITAPTVDQFVPQMVNLELIGGVNFQKGCYPGQEVVARSQYRGTTKRRLFLLAAAAEVAAGQEVFSESDPSQPAGMVVCAAPQPGSADTWHALVELKLAAMEAGLHAGGPDGAPGPVLQRLALPYEVSTAEA